jgi:hypothetical protein
MRQVTANARLYRLGTAAAFVVAPLLLLADNLIHPKEYEPHNEVAQLKAIADAYERWQIAHLIGLFAILALALAMAGLAFLVVRRSPGTGIAGGILALGGLFGFAGVLALDGFTWGVLGHVYGEAGSDQATAARALDEVQNSGWGAPFYVLGAAWIAGLSLLAIEAGRRGALPWPAAGLLVVAAFANGLETVFPSNAYFIVSALVLLAAGAATAAAIRRMDDAECAAGGPAPAAAAEPAR